MLCFDVEVEREAQKMADELGVRVFTANIIYHLFDQFTKYITVRASSFFACEMELPLTSSFSPSFSGADFRTFKSSARRISHLPRSSLVC